jgi:putative endonuclease
MHAGYIIKSETTGRYYVGMTSDINQRLRHHNSGANRSTKNKGPWTIVHKEYFENRNEAWFREKQIKRYKGGKAFKKLIVNGEVA